MARRRGAPTDDGDQPVARRRGVSASLEPDAIAALNRAMTARHWGTYDLAREINVDPHTIAAVRHGRPVRPEVLHRIALALERTPPDRRVEALLDGSIE